MVEQRGAVRAAVCDDGGAVALRLRRVEPFAHGCVRSGAREAHTDRGLRVPKRVAGASRGGGARAKTGSRVAAGTAATVTRGASAAT
eukprot:1339176-Prymnesium_polylepis.1